ncbi:MAG: hypothetical protein ACK5YK_01205 [Pseudomonadota bacterium]
MRKLTLSLAALVAASLTFAAPVMAQELSESTLVMEPTALLGPQLCGVDPAGPAPKNTDCYVVVPDDNDMPVEKLAASTDIEGNYWISPLIVGDMYSKEMLKVYIDAPSIAQYADQDQTEIWPSTLQLNEADAKTHIEITPVLASELCHIFGQRPYPEEGFVPMAALIEDDGMTMYGPLCVMVGFPTEAHDAWFAARGYTIPEGHITPLVAVGLLKDGRWFLDYDLMVVNGLTEMMVPFYDIELPLSTLLNCNEDDPRRGCQNTVASARGGESGYPYIFLTGS